MAIFGALVLLVLGIMFLYYSIVALYASIVAISEGYDWGVGIFGIIISLIFGTITYLFLSFSIGFFVEHTKFT
jgi:hypothetical protein